MSLRLSDLTDSSPPPYLGGYILEFPLIRIDCFTQINPPLPPSLLPAPNALLYLLTHVHTDHLQGLSKSSFNGKIVCSRETKEMLIRLETAAGRRLKAAGMVDRNLKIYGNLKDSRIERTIDLKRAGGLSGPMNVLVDRFVSRFGGGGRSRSCVEIPNTNRLSFHTTSHNFSISGKRPYKSP
jgi:hypothetical protein